ncbi:MAG TPA: outer membrane lipoprotein carrier protein LolA [Bacteroidales bacterium]|nr:outer membrane lipoprotein carrier protein LolA [Bacteroidales bacterium]
MKKQSLILAFCLLTFAVTAQQDPEAMKVLSEFSKRATTAPSVSIDFNLVTDDSRSGDVSDMEGSVVLWGDRFMLRLSENSIWSDGKTVWSYLPDINEVTITENDPDDDSFMSKPSLLFTMYQEGYKVRLIEQTPKDWVIDLYPEDISGDMIRMRLKIGKVDYSLRGAEYKTKEGITITLDTQKYDLAFKPAADVFTFKPSEHKGVEVIDMR